MKPFILKEDNVIFYDVDNTLIAWKYTEQEEKDTISITLRGHSRKFLPISEHIKDLKTHKLMGHKVVVWSASGWEWANTIAEALDIIQNVDVIMSKPKWYVDDEESHLWMKRIYKC